MSVLDRYNAWRKHRRSASELRSLSDRDLADIGAKRDEIDDYVSRKLGS
ncbi:DUF1127 domain-containing protein [Hoeflea poritis]|uniref:DUF1127 domain-containing protein n=1 Tax=Hoeflea poritis TaxID=2993659 RepID=A0ABT4VUN2_9HYPH|nr:DUF1127 domain-containing protein [Hoeflea poritis]MDA4848420.1 DUF1127 domain-containing protein [Hoeflea poritis]